MTEEIIKKYIKKFTNRFFDINYIKIPVTVIKAKIGNEKIFNEIYNAIINDERFKKWPRTKSGGLSIKSHIMLDNNYLYSVVNGTNYIDLTVLFMDDIGYKTCRIQFRPDNYINNNEKNLITGKQSFGIFKRELAKDGIDLETYAISKSEGQKINDEIRKPIINITNELFIDHTFKHVNHLDFHKAYMSGLIEAYPEFRPAAERLAEKAKTDKVYKTVLAATVGYFHSKICGYRFAHLAKAAINGFYKKFDEVTNNLIAAGRTIIANNTDGIFYLGDEYHGKYESDGLCGWSNDLIDLQQIRFKSAGAYEYITNDGKYKPVIRGTTRLDKVRSREFWQWGDIYLDEAQIEMWHFDEKEGISWHKTNL